MKRPKRNLKIPRRTPAPGALETLKELEEAVAMFRKGLSPEDRRRIRWR